MRKLFERLYLPLLLLAVIIRLAIFAIGGNSVRTPWSGGGDMDAYVLLAHNLVSGQGYTYAHFPSAHRTPGYPLFLAAMLELFGAHFIFAARFLQMVAGFATAYFCSKAARIFFGETAARVAMLAALLFPTLLYFSGEILTEGLTSFFSALFLWILAADLEHPSWRRAAGLGLVVGCGTLFRANMAILGLVALLGAWIARSVPRAKMQLAVIPLCAALVVAPWVIRNWITFGRPILSTESGQSALNAALNPESRLIEGSVDRMREKIGYVVPNELETNDPVRIRIGSEVDMDRICWQATREIWSEMGWRTLASIALVKWATYWLSLDQLLHPGKISKLNRLLHVAAVFFYWVLLALAGAGLWWLSKTRPEVAASFLCYAILMTLAHTPFVMDSRIRAPIMDPLIAMLAGGGWIALGGTRSSIEPAAHANAKPN
jgi:4-amino-4-deoxy-L-arabinose transferase-like glycosyltransferase